MENVFKGLQLEICLIYHYDVDISLWCGHLYLDILRTSCSKVLGRMDLNEANAISQTKVECLGHIIFDQGIKPNSEKIEAMALTNKYPEVTLNDLLKDFLCSPLNRLLQWEDIIKWSSACSNAFELLKAALINSPVLSYPSQDETFILDCDASGNNSVQYSHKYTETLEKSNQLCK